jgi:hypothetical protein
MDVIICTLSEKRITENRKPNQFKMQRVNKSKMQKSDKKHCEVCLKAGLAPAYYQSHNMKSIPGPKGIIMCPTIKNAKCKYCGLLGHWDVKFCVAKRRDTKQFEREEREYEKSKESEKSKNTKQEKTKQKTKTNIFALLDTDDDITDDDMSDDDITDNDEEMKIQKMQGKSWASIVQTVPEEQDAEEEEVAYTILSRNGIQQPVYEPVHEPAVRYAHVYEPAVREVRRLRWNDLSDEEDEEY